MQAQAANPVILDAAGSCAVYGVGEFREYVTDANGNLISDSVVVASTPLVVSSAMLPVLEAKTIADAEALLAASGGSPSPSTGHLSINPADQTLNVTPTANAPATLASLSVQGSTVSKNTREFLVNLGLESGTGDGGTAGNDKVTLYSGLNASTGTSDTWTFNTCLNVNTGAAGHNHQGYECDVNNGSGTDFGISGNLATDFGTHVINGISVSGAGKNTCTTAFIANAASTSAPHGQWGRGYTTAGTFAVCGYQDWSTAPVGMQFDGSYSVAALNMTSDYGNAGAVTQTALLMKNDMNIAWQSQDTNTVITDFVDASNNRYVALGSNSGVVGGIFMGATTAPQQNAVFGLGTSTNRWADCYVANVRLPNANVLSWDNNPANNGGVSAFIFDYADASNNRVVGGGSNSIYMGAATNPINPGLDLGTAANYWGTIYSNVGVTVVSDPKFKKQMQPLSGMVDLLMRIDPLSYQFKNDREERLHYGFDAIQVGNALPANHAGHVIGKDGTHMIQKDHLIAVLWSVCQELHLRVKKLEADA